MSYEKLRSELSVPLHHFEKCFLQNTDLPSCFSDMAGVCSMGPVSVGHVPNVATWTDATS